MASIRISDVLKEIFYLEKYLDIEKLSKEELLKEIINLFSKERPDIIKDHVKDSLINALVMREKVGSTGIGKGIAIPHAKHKDVVEHSVVLCLIHGGVEFEALDGELVFLIWLLVGPDDEPDRSLNILERIHAFIRNADFRKFLRDASDEHEVADIIIECDEFLDARE